MNAAITDPMERLIAVALTDAGIDFETDFDGGQTRGLDFYLPAFDLYIEVKQYHSPRIAAQMARAPNVIAVQGRVAVEFFATLLKRDR